MYAWVIREDRLGVPGKAMQIERMPVQKPGKDEVLVMVMAVGINTTMFGPLKVFLSLLLVKILVIILGVLMPQA